MNMMVSPRKKLVVIGNGMAGMRTVEEILHRAPGMFEITVFGAEPQPNYDRIMLSPLLAGDKNFDQIVLNSLEWYAEHNIELIAGEAVIEHRPRRRNVTGEHGTIFQYDILLLATGSNPFVLPLPGVERPGVMTSAPSPMLKKCWRLRGQINPPWLSAAGCSGWRRRMG